jgi:hypothetical protein
VTFAETLAKSQELDRVLAAPLKDGRMPQEIGGKRLAGELGAMFSQIQQVVDKAKLGVAAAASELMEEVRGVEAIEKAVRSETAAVRAFKAQMLGDNALAGENEDKAEQEPKVTGQAAE